MNDNITCFIPLGDVYWVGIRRDSPPHAVLCSQGYIIDRLGSGRVSDRETQTIDVIAMYKASKFPVQNISSS